MESDQSPFFKTTEIPKAEKKAEEESADLLFDRKKVIGRPVKIMRTGKNKPEDGWHITEVYFQALLNGEEKIGQPVVKVRKYDKKRPEMGLEKVVPLQVLEKINPEIKLLIFEKEIDHLLYKDENDRFKTGQIIDINFEEDSLIVRSSRDDDESGSTEKVKISNLLAKSDNPKKLEKIMENKVKKHKAGLFSRIKNIRKKDNIDRAFR